MSLPCAEDLDLLGLLGHVHIWSGLDSGGGGRLCGDLRVSSEPPHTVLVSVALVRLR